MLEITIPGSEDEWDSEKEKFVNRKPCTIKLEHSLISISKWEAKWHIPFMEQKQMNNEQLMDYVRCMTLTQNVDPEVYRHLTRENVYAIQDYMLDPMTATWFGNNEQKTQGGFNKKQVVTSELIYYWMIAQNIPVEFERWHISRLLTLIEVCSIKNKEANGGNKKMNKQQILNQNSKINAARRARLNTKG